MSQRAGTVNEAIVAAGELSSGSSRWIPNAKFGQWERGQNKGFGIPVWAGKIILGRVPGMGV
jgi:hypothetical protein